MIYRLREYIEDLFAAAPESVRAVEVKEEFIQNLTEKYNDLLSEGKSEEAAYNIAVSSVGDVSGLIRELQGLPEQYTALAEENQQLRKRSALLTAIAVGLYIISPIPVIILFNHRLGVVMLFVIVAIATGLLIINNMTKSSAVYAQETMVDEFQEWRGQKSKSNQVYKSISSAVGTLGLIAYFLVSFETGAWYITWVIFPIIGAVNGIIKAIFDLVG